MVGTRANINAEKGKAAFKFTGYLVPFSVTATNVRRPDKVGFWPLSTPNVFIENYGAPIVPHVGAQITGISLRLDDLMAFFGEIFVVCHGCPIRFPR